MQSRDGQGPATQAVAWMWVLAVHAGLSWLLIHQDSTLPKAKESERMRLVFVSVPRTLAPEKRGLVSSTSPAPRDRLPIERPSTAPPPAARPALELVAPALDHVDSDAVAEPNDRWEQSRHWAREPSALAFQADPLRSRRAQLPGGERPGAFRMKEPMSPARVLATIARAFGDKDPCPNIRSRVSGLLTAPSERDRALLQEELRRDREYCRP